MHPVAKRCLIWAVVLVVLGSATLFFGMDLVYRVSEGLNAEERLRNDVISFITYIVHNFALPLAAGLVTAAILIQTLAPPREPEPDED